MSLKDQIEDARKALSGPVYYHYPVGASEPLEVVCAPDYDALAAELAATKAELEQSDHNGDIWCERACAAEAQLAAAEANFRERMDKALAVNEQRLDELSNIKARLAEAQANEGAWEATAQHHYKEARAAEARLAEAKRDVTRLMHLASIGGENAPNDNGEYCRLVATIRAAFSTADSAEVTP